MTGGHTSPVTDNWNTHYRHHCKSVPSLSSHPPPPPFPIIDSVDVAVLSLFEVEVNISLLTNGGQSATQYIVSGRLCASVYGATIVIEV